MRSPRKRSKSAQRQNRSDGRVKKEQLLKVATELYATNGFDRTTSKQICAAATTNVAAVNYHFGSKDGLYEAVLVEVHGQIVSLDVLETIANSASCPALRLRELLKQFLVRPSGSDPPAGLRVLVREMMAPSNHAPALLRKAISPKIKAMLSIVASVLGLPVEHPAVNSATMFVVMPCIMLVIAPRKLLRQSLPAIDTDSESLLDEMTCYVVGGLESLRQAHGGAAPTSPSRVVQPGVSRFEK